MKRFLLGMVAAASLLALPANAFEFGFDGAKSATAAELQAETGIATKYPQWVQGRVEAGQNDWFWDHCSAYVEKMGLAAMTNVNKCLGTHYRINDERSLDRLIPGDVYWMVDLGSDPAAVQAAFTAAAEAEAKATADAAIAPIRDALLSNEEFRAEMAAILEGSAEGVNPWTTPEELQGLRAELFAELEKLGTGPSVEDLSALIGTLLDERGYFTANVDAAVDEALEASDLPERLTALEGRVTTVEGSLANLTTTVDEQGKAIANLPTETRVGEMIAETNSTNWYWLAGLTAAVGVLALLMAIGVLSRRSRWKRLSKVETTAGEALVKADAAHALAQQAFELTFNGHTIEGPLPDFQALSVGDVASLSLINFEGTAALIGFTRIEQVSAEDKRSGLKVTGINGQTNPLPLDTGINRRVLAMLSAAARTGRLDFSRMATVVERMKAAESTAPAVEDAPLMFRHHATVPPAAA